MPLSPFVSPSHTSCPQVCLYVCVSIAWWMDKAVVYIYNRIFLSHKNEHIWVSPNEVDEPRGCYTEWSKSEREKQVSYIHAHIWNLERWCWWAMYFLKIFVEHRAWRNKCTVWLYRGAFILTGNPRITPVVGDDTAWKTPVSTSPRGFREDDVWRAPHKEGLGGGAARCCALSAGCLQELLPKLAWRTGMCYKQRLRRWALRDWKHCHWELSSLVFFFNLFFFCPFSYSSFAYWKSCKFSIYLAFYSLLGQSGNFQTPYMQN